MFNALFTSYANVAKVKIKNFFTDEKGAVDIVAIVVLMGIAVLLALLFQDQITNLLNTLFAAITGNATDAVNGTTGGE